MAPSASYRFLLARGICSRRLGRNRLSGDAAPDNVEGLVEPLVEIAARSDRPDHVGPDHRVLHHPRQFNGSAVRANLAELLPAAQNVGNVAASHFENASEKLRQCVVGQCHPDQAAHQKLAASGLLRETMDHLAQDRLNACRALCTLFGFFDYAKLSLRQRFENRFLGGKVVKKSSLGDIGSLGDLLYWSIGKTALSEQTHRGLEDARMSLATAPFAASVMRGMKHGVVVKHK